MEIHICKDAHTYIWGQHIPGGAWYGEDDQSWWFCTQHGRSDDGSLVLFRFNGVRWVKSAENTPTTRDIWTWAESAGLWWSKCHWFKEEDKRRSLAAKRDAHIKKYENLMKHDRKHKKGCGMRLDKDNYYADKIFIDYECSSNPMHDFQRFYN